ncbi:MAG: TolC family protein [Phycisphaerales bacterium]|nr:TolC family protein [Phycisphaerales bacterium]
MATIVSGCASYEPKPLDAAATRQRLDARTPADEEIIRLAARLAAVPELSARETFNAADALTLAEAEVVALVYNPRLRVARLEVGVTRATAETAGLWDDPVTGINLNDVSQKYGAGLSMGAQIALTIPISGRLAAEKERANAALIADLASVQADEWTARVELRSAWAAWTSAHARTQVVARTADAVSQIRAVVERMEQSGELPRVEARLFRIEQSMVHAELARLRATIAEHEVSIKRILGVAPWAVVALALDEMPLREVAPMESLRTEMVANSPLIAAVRAAYEVSEKALASEIRKQYPDLEIGPTYNTDGNEDFTFGVTLPLPLWNHNQQGVATADAQRELMRVRFETTIELQLAELENAAVVYRRAAEQRRVMESEVAPLADEQAAEIREIARLGEVNTLLLLESLKRQQEARLAIIAAREDEWMALIHLTALVGPARISP